LTFFLGKKIGLFFKQAANAVLSLKTVRALHRASLRVPNESQTLGFLPGQKKGVLMHSVFMPSTGAFSNQFLEGMKQLYELEPFIKVKPYLTNQWEKAGASVKNAS